MTSLLETHHIEETHEGVTLLKQLLGHPEALVSDHTRIGDFENGVETLASLSLLCERGDYLHEIAQRVMSQSSDE